MKLVLAFTALLAAAPATTDKAMIQALDDQFAARANAGDAAAVSAMYTADAMLLAPNAPRMEGRASIQQHWAKMLPAVTDVKLTADEVRRLGPDAIEEIGRYAMRTKATPAQQFQGNYVVIWLKEGGAWKLNTDIGN